MAGSIQLAESKNEISDTLNYIANDIGHGVHDISFRIYLKDHNIILSRDDFRLTVSKKENITEFSGRWRDINVIWEFKKICGGYAIRLKAFSEHELNCISFDSLIFKYKPLTENFLDWRVLQNSEDYVRNPIGFPTVKEALEMNSPCNLITGVFRDNISKGLFLGTVIPQNNRHTYKIEMPEDNVLEFTCTTKFIPSLSSSTSLSSETTWISANKNVKESFDTYANFTPCLPGDPKPITGWNSWDYYYFSVSLDALIENMEEIRKDPNLSENVKYIVIDDGWQHKYGEWEPNYKFPGGLEKAVKEITDRGFIPGIWTAPLLIDTASYAGLRMPELMIKDQYGDPVVHSGSYLLDPTTPSGKDFLKKLYTRLYEIGFRLFKVDYVRSILRVDSFYDKTKAPYEVLRDMFALIRECVTDESHILGCSLPVECGQGVADSGRTGIDIHNQWTHLEWALECYTFKYWAHKRIWINDPDFLIVRGKDTSVEKETNVLNPNQNNPNPPRWRKGDVFDKYEAQTWTNVVMLTGGNVFLSDRISMLNEEGKKLIYKGLQNIGVAAEPLDMCCGYHPSIWLQKLEDEYRLTIINWLDEKKTYNFNFNNYCIEPPKEVTNCWTGVNINIEDGILSVRLNRHESAVFQWKR
ncbi:MAG TPA: hypothetical protein GXX37_02540 [Clostridiaceae bacterium]|nr:hypothetical protein [Clostridiaceae bacterium]